MTWTIHHSPHGKNGFVKLDDFPLIHNNDMDSFFFLFFFYGFLLTKYEHWEIQIRQGVGN